MSRLGDNFCFQMDKKATDKQRLLRDARRNRKAWDSDSREYQKEHGKHLGGEKALAWGVWRIPERELNVLGDVRGKRTLELGSGASWRSRPPHLSSTSVGPTARTPLPEPSLIRTLE